MEIDYGLCCCCMELPCRKNLWTEYTWMGNVEIYGQMLKECFELSLSLNHKPKEQICEICIMQLRNSMNFKRQVLECQAKLAIQVRTDQQTVQIQLDPLETIENDMQCDDDDNFTPEDDMPIKSEKLEQTITNPLQDDELSNDDGDDDSLKNDGDDDIIKNYSDDDSIKNDSDDDFKDTEIVPKREVTKRKKTENIGQNMSESEPAESYRSRDIADYLKSWGLAMYTDKFKEQCIEIDTLKMLSADDLKELVPLIGHRAKLQKQIALLKDNIFDACSAANRADELTTSNNTNVVVNETPVMLDSEEMEGQPARSPSVEADTTTEPNKNCELYRLLNSCNEGRGLLLQFQERALLDNVSRRRLCNLIINNELKDDPEKTINSSRLYQLAYAITQVFRKESTSVYFVPFSSFSPRQKISAKGKLLDCYRHRRRTFLKSGIIKAKEKNCTLSSPYGTRSNLGVSPSSPGIRSNLRVSVPSTSVREVTVQLPESKDDDDKVLWLKNCTHPWETVENYWSVTTKKRLTLLQSNNWTIQQYYFEFKALNQPGGISLLLKDFKCLYPESDQKLRKNWLLIRPRIIELAKSRSLAYLKEVVEDIDTKNNELMNVVAFTAIPFLMTTSNVSKTKSKNKNVWRPSKQEVLEGFITHVKSATHIEETIARRKKKMIDLDLTLQPFIIIVGPTLREISARYIVVNNTRYEVTSIIKAVDACFKIFFVLNAEYPSECYNVWQFIQTALYQLKTKYDKMSTPLNTLCTDLNIQLK